VEEMQQSIRQIGNSTDQSPDGQPAGDQPGTIEGGV
jgi:hypothetical protein